MTFTGTLLPYQRDATRQMIERRKILVAYDLGLGKTAITIASCEWLRDHGTITRPVLVIALASLKYQWAKEVGKFSDSTAQVIDGTKAKRAKQYEDSSSFNYVIMNYETVVNDWDIVSKLEFDAIVMDEATAIKGFKSKRSRKVKELAKTCDIRFALTGTPMENGRPEEIFSIMQAIDGKVLGRFDLFDASYIVRDHWGGVRRYQHLDRLHQRLSRHVIRKSQTDPDVAPHLPDSIHRDPHFVSLDKKCRKIYDTVADELIERLEDVIGTFGSGWDLSAHYGHESPGSPTNPLLRDLMARVMILRQLCSHPLLVLESAQEYESNFRQALLGSTPGRGGSPVSWELVADEKVRLALESAKVPKMDALTGLVSDHLDSDERAKVVVFTSFLATADLINQTLGGVLYSGKMSASEKEAAKVRFQNEPDVRVLVSTDAGGYGVDLPQANLLVNYDLPWSAGRAIQRNGRIKRASSLWPTVVIQDLLVDRSIEIRQHDLLTQKNVVSGAVLDGKGLNNRGGVNLTAGSFLEHLRATRAVSLPV